MKLTYKIENYYPYESRIFVVYTPEDTTLEPLGGWVYINPAQTADEIKKAILDTAPLSKWSTEKSTTILDLIGLSDSGDAIEKIPEVIVPEPPVVPPVVPPTVDQIKTNIVYLTQLRLDEFARTKNYDGILSACTYATSTIPKFAAEGQYAVTARDMTWATLYTFMGEVESGVKPMPTGFADVESLLPVLIWPS